MARNTKEEAIETRNRILDAAENIFHAQGVARTSLADVANAAHVTRGAIYWHFRNKSDLLNAMFERVRLPMESMIEADAEERDADPLARLRSRFVFVLKETVNNPHSRKVFDILLHKCEFVDESDPFFVRHREITREFMAITVQTLRDAVAKGQLPEDLDVDLAGISIQAIVTGLLNNWLFAPESFDLDAIAAPTIDACIDTLRHATSLRKGRGRQR
ncbi:TetR family transcriptional regulator [Noviherbaspirillum cavernae]|uniref:TetR family transcriptional regulator n=1 Tax=Noviherbaspirillum cavernae TaxID=2320862 RepID=A0A418WY24_9BURK|nr:TetR family transcriptional regulator [Noviherbaspirillum cavernae]RJG05129.1 TetR family transcriptional regulator [Noviherbaspirillum cavernae]